MQRFAFSFLTLLCLAFSTLTAQETFSKAASGKKIVFKEIDRLSIVGTSTSDLTISQESSRETNERAKGLQKISASGRKDNTGFGVSVTEEDGVIYVEQVGGKNGRIIVNVPNNAIVEVIQSTYNGGNLLVDDFAGELDVSMHYHRVKLNNTTGPIAINTIYGGITVVLSKSPTNDIRLHSTYSDVDLELPSSVKANVSLSTSYGSMYTDFDILVKSNTGNGRKDGKLNGTINGGGTQISLTATYDDIYLRKQ